MNVNSTKAQYDAHYGSYSSLKWAVEQGCDLEWCIANRPIGVSEGVIEDLYNKAVNEIELEEAMKTGIGRLLYV